MIMNTFENGHRFRNNYLYETTLHQPYDYERNGLIKHIVSNKISGTENPLLSKILSFYEYSIVYMFKFADNLKNFKNFNWKNR